MVAVSEGVFDGKAPGDSVWVAVASWLYVAVTVPDGVARWLWLCDRLAVATGEGVVLCVSVGDAACVPDRVGVSVPEDVVEAACDEVLVADGVRL